MPGWSMELTDYFEEADVHFFAISYTHSDLFTNDLRNQDLRM